MCLDIYFILSLMLIDETLSTPGKYYCQITDFGMHLPSKDYIHPEFDN